MKIGILASICVSALLMPHAVSDDWARPMIETKKIDFGVIATGSEVKKLVEIRNIYNLSVHISEVTTTCGARLWIFEEKNKISENRWFVHGNFC